MVDDCVPLQCGQLGELNSHNMLSTTRRWNTVYEELSQHWILLYIWTEIDLKCILFPDCVLSLFPGGETLSLSQFETGRISHPVVNFVQS